MSCACACEFSMDYIGSFHCIYHTPQRICMIVKEKKFQKYDCHQKKKKKGRISRYMTVRIIY